MQGISVLKMMILFENEIDQFKPENGAYFQREYYKLGEHPFAMITIHLIFTST